MANIARAFDELGAGLLRQADIGGRAYEGAMEKEAETRAADRALAAEQRAAKRDYDKEIRAAEARESEFQRSLEHELNIQRLGHGYSISELRERAELQEQSDIKIFGMRAAHELKVLRMKNFSAIEEARINAKSAKELVNIESNVARAESADKRVTTLVAALSKAESEEEADKIWRELGKAELQVVEAWSKIPGVDPLTTRQIAEHKRFGIVGKEIVSAISLRTTDTIFREAITALKQGKGSSGYDAAYETVSRTIDDIIENDPTFKNYRGVEKRDLKKHIVEKMLPDLELAEESATDIDTPIDGGDGEVLSFKRQAGDPLDRIDEANLEVGAFRKALANQGRPGKSGSRGLEGAKWRDPEWLLPRLESELTRLIGLRDAPGRGRAGARGQSPEFQAKIARVEALILKMKALTNEETSALPQGLNINQSVVGVGGGMVNPRGGMIFEADQMSMDPAAVNARYA